MNSSVARFHTHCKVAGGADPAAVHRMETIAREHLPRLLDPPMNRAPVFLIRQIRARLTVNPAESDSRIAEHWARIIAKELSRQLTSADGQDAGDVVRFDDEAAYISQYLADLAGGSSGAQWYYLPLRADPAASVPERVSSALLLSGGALPKVLARLWKLEVLDRVLDLAGPSAEPLLWRHSGGAPVAAVQKSIGDLIPVALAIAGRLRRVSIEPLEETEIPSLTAAFAASEWFVSADWRDSASLTTAIHGLIRFLERRGRLGGWSSAPVEPSPCLTAFDWLDSARLVEWLGALEPAVRSEGSPAAAGPWPPRIAWRLLSPRQSRLAANLSDAASCCGPALLRQRPDRAAITLHAALLASYPDWEGDDSAVAMVRQYVDRLVRPSNPAIPLNAALPDAAPETAPTVTALPVTELPVTELPVTAPEPKSGDRVIRSQCAGIFLLARAIADSGLLGCLEASRLPVSVPDVLGSLAMDWLEPRAGGTLMPGIPEFAGGDISVESIQNGWARVAEAEHTGFRTRFADHLANLRVPAVEYRGDPRQWLSRSLLRLWTQWLRGFSESSPEFVLDTFIRRGGWLEIGDDTIDVLLEPKPLDVVIRLSGYDSDVRAVWLRGRTVRFHMREG